MAAAKPKPRAVSFHNSVPAGVRCSHSFRHRVGQRIGAYWSRSQLDGRKSKIARDWNKETRSGTPAAMHEVLQATATVLSLINPVVCAAMFNVAMSGQDRSARLAAATKALLAIAIILILAALFGTKLLALFGISLDAFAVAGGGILIWIGIGMFNPGGNTTSTSTEASNSLGPLIMFGASPGTITGVITIAAHHSGTDLPISALIAIVIAVLVTWIVVVSLSQLGRTARPSFWRSLATRYMGLIVIAMGVQFALSGWKAFMA